MLRSSEHAVKIACLAKFLAFANVNMNKVDIFTESYKINLHVTPFDVHFHYIYNAFMCTA